MKLDIVSSLTLHGLTFNRVFGGIYKNEDIKDELYLDSAVQRMGVAGDRVKVQILVEHLVVMESKWCKTYEEAIQILEKKTKPFLKLAR